MTEPAQSQVPGPIVLIGAGNMGAALLDGWLRAGLWPAGSLAIDPNPSDWLTAQVKTGRVAWTPNAAGAEVTARLCVLAVKPHRIADALAAAAARLAEGAVVVSVAAGTRLPALILADRPDLKPVRVMPNTPARLGAGMSVGFAGPGCGAEERAAVQALMEAVGAMAWVEAEEQLDAVTAVSGSGPAYVFHLAECLAAAGQAAGLPADLAARLARHTVYGAGVMLAQPEAEAAHLREAVTSPGGTTAAALEVLMGAGRLKGLMIEAVAAATRRAEALSEAAGSTEDTDGDGR